MVRTPTIPLLLFTTLWLGGVGCKPAADDLVHPVEPKTAQITVWTERYEVFAEHRAPIAGKATTFITHITDLQTLQPRPEGMVKFVLRQSETVSEHPQAGPARPGIYLPGIIFPGPGEWLVTLLIPTDGTPVPVELGAIEVYPDVDSAAQAEIPDAPEGVSFLKEQQWKILSQTEAATKRRLTERARVAARVRAKPGFSATVNTPVSGQLILPSDQEWPHPGQPVVAGQLLGLLKPNFSEAGAKVAEVQAEFATAKAAIHQTEAAYARTKKLAAEQAKSARELQEVEFAYQSARARYAAAAGLLATLRTEGQTASPDTPLLMELRAPISGVLNSVTAGPGEVVGANQSLFTVLNPETVWIEGHVPEAAVARLSAAKAAYIESSLEPGRFVPITGEGRGRVLSLGLEVDALTRTVPLIYEITNSETRFRVGQNITLHVETSHAEDAVAVPESALVEEGDQLIAFVQVSGETFQKRDLEAGIHDAGFVQVVSGIREGERVVTKGAYAIRLSSISGVIPAHGHAH